MIEVQSGQGRGRGLRRIAAGSALILAAMTLSLTPAESAGAAECPADYCTERVTNSEGFYLLAIPAYGITFVPGGAALADCKWEVEAQFSDGSPAEHYTFDATKSF